MRKLIAIGLVPATAAACQDVPEAQQPHYQQQTPYQQRQPYQPPSNAPVFGQPQPYRPYDSRAR